MIENIFSAIGGAVVGAIFGIGAYAIKIGPCLAAMGTDVKNIKERLSSIESRMNGIIKGEYDNTGTKK